MAPERDGAGKRSRTGEEPEAAPGESHDEVDRWETGGRALLPS